MKYRILLFFFCMVSLNMTGQVIVRDKCEICGELLSQCKYKGKHPTCKTCGKLLEKCQYKGKHPTCKTCGKLVENCEHNGNHPKCVTCGRLVEKCQYHGIHPKCSDCGKLVEDCLFNGKHPKCATCGKLTEECEHKGKHPTCVTCGKLVEQCEHKGNHPVCRTCNKLIDNCEYKGYHPVCATCGKLVEKCDYEGNHPVCTTCGKIVDKCDYKGKHPAPPTPSEKPQSYFNRNEIYMMPEFQAGSLMALGGTVGGYVANVNAEGYFHYGLTESDAIWWNPDVGHTGYPYLATYRPLSYGVRFGYGITLGSRIRLTPQLGLGFVSMTGSSSDSRRQAYRGSATSGTIAVKADIAIVKHFAFGIAPEYHICLSKSDTYEMLSSASSTFDKWAKGFNCRIFLSVYF